MNPTSLNIPSPKIYVIDIDRTLIAKKKTDVSPEVKKYLAYEKISDWGK